MTNTTQPQGSQGKQPDTEAVSTFEKLSRGLGDLTDPAHRSDAQATERKRNPGLSPILTFDQLAGLRLKQHREAAGMKNQQQVADALREKAGRVLGRSAVTKWEAGKHRWTIDDLMAVCITFDLTLDQLVLPPDETDYDADWFDLVGRPVDEAGLWVTGVYAHSIESPQGDFDPVVRRRDDLSARLFGVKPGYLEKMREQPKSVHIAELERLNKLRATVDQATAFHLAQLEQEGGS